MGCVAIVPPTASCEYREHDRNRNRTFRSGDRRGDGGRRSPSSNGTTDTPAPAPPAADRVGLRVALDQLLEDDARFPRRQMRVDIDLPVTVSAEGRHGTGHFINLSQQGARFEAESVWARDQLLRLQAEGMPPLYAKVRWRRDFTHGLVFEETFSLRDFAYLLARLHKIV